jgi:hypothetical protein
MYNTSVQCTYMNIENVELSNEVYQSELLSVFGLSEYSETLTTEMDRLHKVVDSILIQEILKHVPFFSQDPEMLFMVLFSYDYFKYTHALITKIITKQDTKQCHEELLAILKNNN